MPKLRRRMNTRRDDCLSSPNCPAWLWSLCGRADSCIHSRSSLHSHVWRQFTGSFVDVLAIYGWSRKWMSRARVLKEHWSDFTMNSQQEDFSIKCSNLHCLNSKLHHSDTFKTFRKSVSVCLGSVGSVRKMCCVWSACSHCRGCSHLSNSDSRIMELPLKHSGDCAMLATCCRGNS